MKKRDSIFGTVLLALFVMVVGTFVVWHIVREVSCETGNGVWVRPSFGWEYCLKVPNDR